MSAGWNWYADDSTSNADKAWNAVIVGGVTAGLSYFLPLPNSNFYFDPFGMVPGNTGFEMNKYLFMGLVGAGSSLIADFGHDMILHNLGLPADLEKNSNYLLRGVLGGIGGGAAMWVANPEVFAQLPMWVSPGVGAVGEIGGTYLAQMLNKKK